MRRLLQDSPAIKSVFYSRLDLPEATFNDEPFEIMFPLKSVRFAKICVQLSEVIKLIYLKPVPFAVNLAFLSALFCL